MTLTVGKKGDSNYRVVPKRTSLRDRQRISQINKERESKGEQKLKGTENLEVPLESQQQKKEAEQAQKNAETQQLKTAQTTVRQLNESAARSGSSVQYDLVNRGGDVQIVKRTVERRNASLAQNVAGANQVPALQSSVSRQETTTKEEFLPVASAREGGVFVQQSSTGDVFREVGTAKEGGTVLSETNPQPVYVDSKPVFSTRRGSEFATPFLAIGPERRKDIIKAGEFLSAGGKKAFALSEEAPAPANVALLTTSVTSSFLGGTLQRFGSDPQGFAFKEVVLPSTGGAVLGAASNVVVRSAPKIVTASTGVPLTKVGSKVVTGVTQASLGTAGVVALGATVISRKPEEQSVDVVFGGLGARAGARQITGLDTSVKDAVFYGGAPSGGAKNRAERLNLRTAGKPQTKAERSKESLKQNYNPNIYKQGSEFGIKEGKSREFVRFTQQGVEVGKRFPATELGVKGQSFEKGFVVTKGQAPQDFQRFTFTSSGKSPEPLAGSSKAFRQANRPDYKLGYQDTVVAIQQSKGFQAVKVFEQGKRVPIKPQERFTDSSQFLAETKSVPYYELTPNAKVFTGSRSVVESRVAGSQAGRGRVYENLIASARAKNAARTDFVLVDSPIAPQTVVASSPIKDIALSSRFSGVPSVASSKGFTSVSAGSSVLGGSPVIDVKPVAGVVSRPIQNIKPFTATINEQQKATRTTPALTIIQNERTAATPKVFQNQQIESLTIIKPEVKQTPVAAQRIVVQQRNEQRTEAIKATGFDFQGTPAPTLKFDFKTTQNPPPPPKISNPIKPVPPPPKERFFRYVQPPPTPKAGFFGKPNSKLSVPQYQVQVGSKGNKYFFDLGRGGNEVLEQARDLAKGTAAASIRVKPLSRGSEDNISSLLGNDFIKNKSGVYIQKNETRISSAGEKQQITGARRKTRLTKKSDYGTALNKVNSGASLRGVRRGFF